MAVVAAAGCIQGGGTGLGHSSRGIVSGRGVVKLVAGNIDRHLAYEEVDVVEGEIHQETRTNKGVVKCF